MLVKKLVVGPIQANCFIIGDEKTNRGAIIDPGDDGELIWKTVEEMGLDIRYIIATHGHFDHVGGMAYLKEKLPKVPFLIHKEDIFFVEESKKSAFQWGISIDQVPDPDGYLEDGQKIEVGDIVLEVVHTPGHSPGGVSLLTGKRIFVGDTLFQGSIGRTDFRKGSMYQLKDSIRKRLYTLPEDTVVYTGHGPETTIGEEKKFNMFVRG